MNGFDVSREKLGNPHVRKFMEAMAILTEMAQESVVLNLGKNLEDKKRDWLVRRVPKMRPLEREKFLRMWAAKAGMLSVK